VHDHIAVIEHDPASVPLTVERPDAVVPL
jgi:hypothetical protein